MTKNEISSQIGTYFRKIPTLRDDRTKQISILSLASDCCILQQIAMVFFDTLFTF